MSQPLWREVAAVTLFLLGLLIGTAAAVAATFFVLGILWDLLHPIVVG